MLKEVFLLVILSARDRTLETYEIGEIFPSNVLIQEVLEKWKSQGFHNVTAKIDKRYILEEV